MSTVTTRLGLTKPAGIEQFNLATYNNNLDLVDTYAVNTVEKLAKGLPLSPIQVTTSSAAVTDVIVNNIATFTFKAGRKYRIGWEFSWSSSVASTYAYFVIGTCPVADSASLLTGITTLNGRTYTVQNVASTESGFAYAYFEPTSDSTLQIKFRVTRAAGTGTITVLGNAGEKAVYYIEDLGAQY